MTQMLDKLIEYGYIILFIYSLGGGMLALLAASVLSTTTQSLDLSLCILLAFVSNTLGSTLTYLLAKYYKKDLKGFVSKHRRKLALISIKIKKHDILLIFSQKYIYGMKSLVPFAAGLIRLNFLRFCFINTLACLLWALVVGACGALFAPFISSFFQRLSNYPFLAPLFLVVLTTIFLIYLNKVGKKKA